MDFSSNQAKQLYQQLNGEKIIVGIKDENFKIKFIKSNIWIVPLIMVIAIILNLGLLQQVLVGAEMILVIIAGIIFTLCTIFGFLSQVYELYFDNYNLVLENKLGKREIIDVSRYPRIYIRQKSYENYDRFTDTYNREQEYLLYLEQDNKCIKLSINGIGTNKIKNILANFELKSSDEVTDEQWKESASDKERIFFKYMYFLNEQEKVIGVKDSSQKIKIKKDFLSKPKKGFFICTLVMLLFFGIEFMFFKTRSNIGDFLMFAGCFLFVFDLMFFVKMIEEGGGHSLKVSYPEDDCLRINNFRFYYKRHDVKMGIEAVQFSEWEEKYKYFLRIRSNDKSYSFPLNPKDENQIGDFIDNLIFESKNR